MIPSSPIVPVYTPPVSHHKVEVLEPLDRPPPCSHCPRHTKTPYVINSLSPLPPPIPVKRPPSPPLVVSPIIHRVPTISIPPCYTPILVPPTLRKRACCEPLPSAKKRRPANTSMCFLLSFYFFIIDVFFRAQNLQFLFGLCLGHPFLNLVPALFAFPTCKEMVCSFYLYIYMLIPY